MKKWNWFLKLFIINWYVLSYSFIIIIIMMIMIVITIIMMIISIMLMKRWFNGCRYICLNDDYDYDDNNDYDS